MLMLVLGANYLVMFVGWEGVGLCSYLLIGFYYDKKFAADAGKKAFIVNRIGDFGFVLGIFADLRRLRHRSTTRRVFAQPAGDAGRRRYAGVATGLICLLLFVGACGKSRADPALRLAARRHGRPDAGLGADPRRHDGHRRRLHGRRARTSLFRLAPDAMIVVARRRRAHRALRRHDRPRPERHQEGARLLDRLAARLHVPRRAASAPTRPAIFHLMTHAFFKACLFLGSGSVIHAHAAASRTCARWAACSEVHAARPTGPSSSPRWRSPASRRSPASSPRTRSSAARSAYVEAAAVLWVVGLVTAGLTAFYMFRLYYMTFEGEYRGAQSRGSSSRNRSTPATI